MIGVNQAFKSTRTFGGRQSMVTETPSRILENLATSVLTFDHDLRLTSINPAGEMLFEVSAKKILGHKLDKLLPQTRRMVKTLTETLKSRQPFTAHGIQLKLPGERVITVDCTVSPLVHDSCPEIALLVELTQVDRLMRLARDESMLDRQAANRAVMRGLAHEIKNPLGGLRGAAQLLERELPDKELREYTRIIIHEADRLRNLVDRMMGPHQLLQKKPVNIHEILEHVRNLILVEIPVGLTVEREYDPSIPEFEGEPERIIQAVLNIVRNSTEAMRQKGIIHLRTSIERGFSIGHKRHRLVLRVDIQDNGPGIPEEIQEYIFYPMVTATPGGTGLGLSIAQDILSKHGGLIECRSQPGQTVFSLFIPLENDHG